MEVNCESMAVIGATLANGGTCPITQDAVIKPEAVRDVMSLLHSCGFYEYSGQFAFKVLIPTFKNPEWPSCIDVFASDRSSRKVEQSRSNVDGFAKHHGHLYLLSPNRSVR